MLAHASIIVEGAKRTANRYSSATRICSATLMSEEGTRTLNGTRSNGWETSIVRSTPVILARAADAIPNAPAMFDMR